MAAVAQLQVTRRGGRMQRGGPDKGVEGRQRWASRRKAAGGREDRVEAESGK